MKGVLVLGCIYHVCVIVQGFTLVQVISRIDSQGVDTLPTTTDLPTSFASSSAGYRLTDDPSNASDLVVTCGSGVQTTYLATSRFRNELSTPNGVVSTQLGGAVA